MVPSTLHSGSFDQLNDFRGFEDWGTLRLILAFDCCLLDDPKLGGGGGPGGGGGAMGGAGGGVGGCGQGEVAARL